MYKAIKNHFLLNNYFIGEMEGYSLYSSAVYDKGGFPKQNMEFS